MSNSFTGERWEFELGNSTICIDNAHARDGWGQERFLLNGEVAHAAEGAMRFKQDFREPWLASVGETEIEIRLESGLFSIKCCAFLDGKRLEPTRYFQAQWSGERLSWPAEAEWVQQPYHEPIMSISEWFRSRWGK